MGKFVYNGNVKVEFEDRLLAHLQVAIVNKLRRGESFQFTWRDDSSTGGGRTSIWVNPQSSLIYKFYGSRPPALNPAWLEALAFVANSPAGLHVVPEPEDAAEEPLTDENA
ncbi:MAG: ATP-dependent DNA ligase [Microbacterium sp.]|uniref:DUF7882 family protein n=1 Tax=Microbacterium sp. TaxID=51671 RepID=UPI001AC57AD2|nr:ATP-dependent DNA ligase [Microbacterium sp.]MBN9153681.1 ATP-dependent DNA ligase [Microbacterium sp.]MBN9173075.1 ATP-dependent DNA ligase [Microbacterium sp.]MBN9181203.1 ATP-dependent DNA ligase [Microbacterium sp.]MBN9185254.1 ATP-dependent DNA ligase [Microbacterium sp.]MBN9189104.1 ATP-dependent DNA ligase [Microbacterium sp.]